MYLNKIINKNWFQNLLFFPVIKIIWNVDFGSLINLIFSIIFTVLIIYCVLIMFNEKRVTYTLTKIEKKQKYDKYIFILLHLFFLSFIGIGIYTSCIKIKHLNNSIEFITVVFNFIFLIYLFIYRFNIFSKNLTLYEKS